MRTDDFDPYAELVKERSPLLFCDVCMHYPIEPEQPSLAVSVSAREPS